MWRNFPLTYTIPYILCLHLVPCSVRHPNKIIVFKRSSYLYGFGRKGCLIFSKIGLSYLILVGNSLWTTSSIFWWELYGFGQSERLSYLAGNYLFFIIYGVVGFVWLVSLYCLHLATVAPSLWIISSIYLTYSENAWSEVLPSLMMRF